MQLGGVNREVFHPYGGPKKYPLLAVGDSRRAWKGHDTILEAGRLLGLPVEEYAPKDLSQADLGREYDAAGCSWSAAGSRASASPASKPWPAACRW